jgi:hypothetical protein
MARLGAREVGIGEDLGVELLVLFEVLAMEALAVDLRSRDSGFRSQESE